MTSSVEHNEHNGRWTKGYINALNRLHMLSGSGDIVPPKMRAEEASHSETEEKQFIVTHDDHNQIEVEHREYVVAHKEESSLSSPTQSEKGFAVMTSLSGEYYPQIKAPVSVESPVSNSSTKTIQHGINNLNVPKANDSENPPEIKYLTKQMTGQSSSHLDEQIMAKPEYDKSQKSSNKDTNRRFISLEDLVMSTMTYSPDTFRH